jgi:hypothetical protein
LSPSLPSREYPSSNPAKRKPNDEPRLNVVTLAVDDLERALAFYRDVAPGVRGFDWTSPSV